MNLKEFKNFKKIKNDDYYFKKLKKWIKNILKIKNQWKKL